MQSLSKYTNLEVRLQGWRKLFLTLALGGQGAVNWSLNYDKKHKWSTKKEVHKLNIEAQHSKHQKDTQDNQNITKF